jgi:copper transport protein
VSITALLALLMLMVVVPVQAHGFLVRAIPADRSTLERAPTRVQYWFSEGLEPAFSKIVVRDATGQSIAEGGVDPANNTLLSAELPPGLPDGAYLSELRLAFASDGHVIVESRVFFIGTAVGGIDSAVGSTTAEIGEVIWRIGTLIGLILAFGLVVAYNAVMLPAWGSRAHPAGGLPPRVMHRLTLMMFAALGLTVIAQVYALLYQSVTFFGVSFDAVLSGGLWQIVRTGTRFGDVWNVRMLTLGVVTALIAAAWFYRKTQPGWVRPFWATAAWALAFALGASSVISHASGSRTEPWISLFLDWAHLMGVAFWIGTLSALLLVLPAALMPLQGDSRRRALLAALNRFSPMAVGALAMLITAGIFSATLWVRPADLTSTAYGGTLLIKTLLVLLIVGMGALHHAALNPERFARLNTLAAHLGGLTRTLHIEALLGLVVLIAAAALSATPVPVPENTASTVAALHETTTVGDIEISLTISPGGPGPNTFDLQAIRDGQPVAIAEGILQTSQPDLDQRNPAGPLEPLAEGALTTVNGDLTRAGTWWATVDLALADGQIVRAAFALDVRAEAAIEQTIPLTGWQALALVLATLGSLRAIYPASSRLSKRLGLSRTNLIVIGLATVGTVAAFILGLGIVASESERYTQSLIIAPQIINPTLPDQTSITLGSVAFQEFCPAWRLDDAPTRAGREALRQREPRNRDEDLFLATRDGFRGLAACDPMSDLMRWDVVNALRQQLIIKTF